MNFRGEKMSEGSEYLQPGVHVCEIFLGKETTFYSEKKQRDYRKVGIGFRAASGASVFADYFLEPESLWLLEKLFVAAGIDKEDVDLIDLVGEFVVVRVKHETYKKKDGSQGTKSVVESIEPSPKDGETVTYHDESGDKVVDGSKSDPF